MSEGASIRSAGSERDRNDHGDQSNTQSPLSREAAQELIRSNDWQRDAMKRSAHARELQGKALLHAGGGNLSNAEEQRAEHGGGCSTIGAENGRGKSRGAKPDSDKNGGDNPRHIEQHSRSSWQQLLDARQEIRNDRHYANQEKAERKDAQYLVRDSKKTAYEGRMLLRRSQREFNHGCVGQGMSDQKDAIMLLNESLKETAQGRDNWSRAQVDLDDARRRYSAARRALGESRRQGSNEAHCQSTQQPDNSTRYPTRPEQTTEWPPLPSGQTPQSSDQQQEQLEYSNMRYPRQPVQENYSTGSYNDRQPNFFQRALQTMQHLTDRVHISLGLGNNYFGNYGYQRPYYQNNNYLYQNQNPYQQPYYPNNSIDQTQYNNGYYNNNIDQTQYNNGYYNNQVYPGNFRHRHHNQTQSQSTPAPQYEYYG
jgi:hypothetical protein